MFDYRTGDRFRLIIPSLLTAVRCKWRLTFGRTALSLYTEHRSVGNRLPI